MLLLIQNDRKYTTFFLDVQIKIAFGVIFVYRWGFLAGGSAKRTPKRHERFWDPAEQDCQEEGERQYRMYQSEKGTRGEIREH